MLLVSAPILLVFVPPFRSRPLPERVCKPTVRQPMSRLPNSFRTLSVHHVSCLLPLRRVARADPTIDSSSTVSGASSSLLSSTATSASTTTHASSSSVSATSSGAATGLVSSLALDGAFGGVVALAGALVGAALVL